MTGVALQRPPRLVGASFFLLAAALACLAVAVAAAPLATPAAAGAGALAIGALAVRAPVIPWSRVLALLVLVIMLIPIRRYKLPIEFAVQLEPYRLVVALIFAAWLASLLADSRVTLRRSGFEGAIGVIVLAVFVSIAINPSRADEMQQTVLKQVTFFLSFLVVFYLVVSVVRSRATADTVIKTLVLSGAVVAFLAIIEARTEFSPFNRLQDVIPFLAADENLSTELGRGGAVRAFGSAEHPIALCAALVMLIPLGIYVVRGNGPIWYVPLTMLGVGALSTVSRTGVVMLVVVGLVFLWLRGRDTRRFLPMLLPLLVATHFAAPGTLGALEQALFPEGGLIQDQRKSEGSCSSAGRVSDLAPTLAELSRSPFFGIGFGTRETSGPDANACILDNEWLGTLLETGLVGFVAWWALFLGVIRRFGRRAKQDPSDEGWLLVAVTASLAGFAIGMFTYDAFTFIQVTFLLFIILGLGAAVARSSSPFALGRPKPWPRAG
jgi:O-antigen ligase